MNTLKNVDTRRRYHQKGKHCIQLYISCYISFDYSAESFYQLKLPKTQTIVVRSTCHDTIDINCRHMQFNIVWNYCGRVAVDSCFRFANISRVETFELLMWRHDRIANAGYIVLRACKQLSRNACSSDGYAQCACARASMAVDSRTFRT